MPASCIQSNNKTKLMLQYINRAGDTKKNIAANIVVFLIFCFLSTHISAQSGSAILSGSVQDDKGNPVSFASVVIKGTVSGTSADAGGKFSLRLNRLPAVITIRAVGFETYEQTITDGLVRDSSHRLTIVLHGSTKDELKEVVVTSAYAVKRSARSVHAASYAADAVLAGKVAGVSVRSEAWAGGEVSATTGRNRTKLLTAGELSDFKKWNLWEGYSNAEFFSYGSKWNLYAKARYAIQLQNENGRAITGQPVYLVNSNTGDTAWAAVSDNTGKAELWNNFAMGSNGNEEEQMEIHIRGEKEIYTANLFEDGINLITLNRSCATSAKVDIAFVVDATGSMGDEIEYLKEELGDILGKITAQDPSVDLRTGAVFYRDNYDEYVTRIQPLTPGINQTIGFIKKQSAGGGGDYPEAVEKALEASIEKLAWSSDARTRLIFLVLDAPPHDEAKDRLAATIRNAAARGIRIVPVACSGTDKSTEFILRSIALATNGTYLFLTDDSGIGNKHIKPTTDEYKVELLNDLLQKVIAQMCFANGCETNSQLSNTPLAEYKVFDSVKIFPNPSHGPVTLKTDLKLKDIYVADFTGKIIRSLDARKNKNTYRFDMSDLPAATYLIRYTTEDNKAGATKLVLIR